MTTNSRSPEMESKCDNSAQTLVISSVLGAGFLFLNNAPSTITLPFLIIKEMLGVEKEEEEDE